MRRTGARAARRPGKTERHRRIIAEAKASPTIRISLLADEFGVSTETVRRDVDELTSSGMLSRTYGGAVAAGIASEPGIIERANTLVAERERIARAAERLVEEGEVLMIDAGSTALHLARRLAASGKRLSVLTNCIGVATALAAAETVRVVMCPGDYVRREGGVFGAETIEFLKRFHASRAVIGASGLTVEGATEVDSAAAWVKRTMLERADRRMLVLDRSKFDQRRLEVVAPLGRFDDIVTDAEPAGRLRDALAAAGVNLHVASADNGVPRASTSSARGPRPEPVEG